MGKKNSLNFSFNTKDLLLASFIHQANSSNSGKTALSEVISNLSLKNSNGASYVLSINFYNNDNSISGIQYFGLDDLQGNSSGGFNGNFGLSNSFLNSLANSAGLFKSPVDVKSTKQTFYTLNTKTGKNVKFYVKLDSTGNVTIRGRDC